MTGIPPSKKQIGKAILTLKGLIEKHKQQRGDEKYRNVGGGERQFKRDTYGAAINELENDKI